MTTIAELIDRALTPMRDPDQDFFEDTEMLAYVNEATRDLAARLKLLEKEEAASITGDLIALPDDCLQARWVRADEDDSQVVFLDESTFFAYRSGTEGTPDAPIATNYADRILTSPALEGTWYLGYYALPPVAASTGEAFPLVALYEDKVVHFARSRCYGRLGDRDMARDEMGLYESGLPGMDRAFQRNRPGLMTISRQGNAFDSDVDSIHRGS
jgi:hypothetical protein